jgi:tRNA-dihydrouridine synthase B
MTGQLPPLRLGALQVGFPIGLAALSGYSDWPARVIARRLGAGCAVSEVLLDQFVLNVAKGRKARRFLRITDDDHPTGAQLMGSMADEITSAAGKLVEMGFDFIDVNFACPVKKVLGKRRGGYLLSQPERALEIVARVREAVPPQVPVTLKMRRGTDGSQQSRDHFFTILDGAFRLGAAAVTVHGRTVEQRYAGRSSRAFLREVKQHAADHTVLGSGDLFTAGDCLAMMAETGVDGVAVARGAIGNPWIFREAQALGAGLPLPAPPGLFEQREVIAEHYRLAEEHYGAGRACFVMRKSGIKYSRLHPQAERVRDAFVAVRSPGQWREVLATWYAEDLPGRYPEQP